MRSGDGDIDIHNLHIAFDFRFSHSIPQAGNDGIKIHDLEIALEGNFENILKWAGLSNEGNPGYPAINAKVFVKADADEKTLREIWKLAVDGSPVTQTVARETKIITEFEAV